MSRKIRLKQGWPYFLRVVYLEAIYMLLELVKQIFSLGESGDMFVKISEKLAKPSHQA